MQKVLGGSHERRGQGRGACPGHSGAASEAEGAVAAMRMEGLQRSRMGSGQASAAGSMLLRAAAMGPGQCLSAEFFLGDGRGCPAGHCTTLALQPFGSVLSARHAHATSAFSARRPLYGSQSLSSRLQCWETHTYIRDT